MPSHKGVIHDLGFKGINNVLRPEVTDIHYFKKALNIDIDKAGSVFKREGYSQVLNKTITSLWASERRLGCYIAFDSNLYRLYEDYSYVLVLSDVGTDKISFEEVDGVVYFSSISINGIIIDGSAYSWGIPKNLIQPTLTAGTGGLSAGTYQVMFTYVNQQGIESGSVNSSFIQVDNNSSISLYIPAVSDTNILYSRVYCSTPNGTTNYYAGMGTLGSTYTISSISSFSNPIRTQGLDNAPTGHIVRYYKGVMYVAQDNILWYSEPFQYQHFNLASNYFEFPDRITEVMPVEEGIWIGADKLYYLSGDKPDEFKRIVKEHLTIIGGTSTRVSGSYVHMDNMPLGYKWLVTTNLGIFILFNQGMASNLTSANIDISSSDSGTSLFLRSNGTNQYLSILKTNENPNNSTIGDLVEAVIIRNSN